MSLIKRAISKKGGESGAKDGWPLKDGVRILPKGHPFEMLPAGAIRAFLKSELTDLEVVEDFYAFTNCLFFLRHLNEIELKEFHRIAKVKGQVQTLVYNFYGKTIPTKEERIRSSSNAVPMHPQEPQEPDEDMEAFLPKPVSKIDLDALRRADLSVSDTSSSSNSVIKRLLQKKAEREAALVHVNPIETPELSFEETKNFDSESDNDARHSDENSAEEHETFVKVAQATTTDLDQDMPVRINVDNISKDEEDVETPKSDKADYGDGTIVALKISRIKNKKKKSSSSKSLSRKHSRSYSRDRAHRSASESKLTVNPITESDEDLSGGMIDQTNSSVASDEKTKADIGDEWTLHQVIANDQGRDAFREFLAQEHSEENLYFYMSVISYKVISTDLKDDALLVIKHYILPTALRQVNLPASLTKKLIANVEAGNCTIHLFDEALRTIAQLLIPAFERFKQATYPSLVETLGAPPASTPVPDPLQSVAIDIAHDHKSVENEDTYTAPAPIAATPVAIMAEALTEEESSAVNDKPSVEATPLPSQSIAYSKMRPLPRRFSTTVLDKLFQKINPKEKYSKTREIGAGSYGTVMVGKSITKEGPQVAMKIIEGIAKTERRLHTVAAEITVLQDSKHPNIVRFVECFLWKDTITLVMEFCDGDTLKKLLVLKLKESHIAYLTHQIVSALSYIHLHGKVHRDIKSNNIFLNIDGTLKLGDFGLVTDCTKPQELTKLCGSRNWMAPEMIQGYGYDWKADIWSLGGVLFEMFTGSPPWSKVKPLTQLYYTCDRGMEPLSAETRSKLMLSIDGRDFWSKCCQPKPVDRASSSELKAHPWLEKRCTDEEIQVLLKQAFVINATEKFMYFDG